MDQGRAARLFIDVLHRVRRFQQKADWGFRSVSWLQPEWRHEDSERFCVSPLARWAVSVPPRSLGSAFADKMSAASYGA